MKLELASQAVTPLELPFGQWLQYLSNPHFLSHQIQILSMLSQRQPQVSFFCKLGCLYFTFEHFWDAFWIFRLLYCRITLKTQNHQLCSSEEKNVIKNLKHDYIKALDLYKSPPLVSILAVADPNFFNRLSTMLNRPGKSCKHHCLTAIKKLQCKFRKRTQCIN